jgi:hypothetical protein
MKIILTTQRRKYVSNAGIFLITAVIITAMIGFGGTCYRPSYNPTPSENLEIRTWYDLDAVRDNLAGKHTVMNDLDSTTLGYEELSSPTANGGKGWQPIGTEDNLFTGTFDGQGYEIKNLFINRPSESGVGLFCGVGKGVVIKNLGVVNVTVTGMQGVGGLVGGGNGNVSNSYSTGSVTGYGSLVGGLVGIGYGNVSNSHSTASITGNNFFNYVGGLVGANLGTVSNSYATGNVTGGDFVGGLVGGGYSVINSYATGNVTGDDYVGGLVGDAGSVSNSYSTGSVTGDNHVGGLVGANEGTVSESYSTGSVNGNSNVGGLVGANDGTVSNSYSTGSVTGNSSVGGLVGGSDGTVSDSFWDIKTSGQNVSDGGTGKNTTEMQDIMTFSGAGWNITTVSGIGERNITYIWNIVNNVTYPFLSWQA